MKRLSLLCLLFLSLTINSQDKIPEGWDLITLNGKPAYMNLITGDVSVSKPTSPATAPKKKVEVDPSTYHTVAKGETLFSIAKKYNITVQEIYRLNTGFDYENISVGQQIVVGYDKAKEGTIIFVDDSTSYTDPSNNTIYYVKRGDTLYSIARKNGLTVAFLKEINNLTSNELSVGQKIKLQQ